MRSPEAIEDAVEQKRKGKEKNGEAVEHAAVCTQSKTFLLIWGSVQRSTSSAF